MSKRSVGARAQLLFVSSHAPISKGWGGIPPTAGAYLTALADGPFEIAYLCSTASCDNPILDERFRAEYPFVSPHLYAAPKAKWGLGIGLFRYAPQIARADYVLIHGVLGAPSLLAMLIRGLVARPYAVVPHGGLDSSRLNEIAARRPVIYSLLKVILRGLLERVHALVLTGSHELSALAPWVESSHVVFIQNFLDFDLNASPSPPEHARRYLFVGRLEKDKGIKRFVEIWSETARPESRLELIGSGSSSYTKALYALAADDDRVVFSGELGRQEVVDAMRQASVVVLPTGLDQPVTENFGNVVAEALIEGRPALVTKGLHWDIFEPHPALFTFGRTDEEVANQIRRFEQLEVKDYPPLTKAARALARSFHVNESKAKVRGLFVQGP